MVPLYIVSAMFGLFQGGIVPAYAIIIREHFDPKEAGARVGSVIMATLLGMALGGWMSGWVFDVTGSYHAAFLNGIAWNLLNLCIASWLFWRVRKLNALTPSDQAGAVPSRAGWPLKLSTIQPTRTPLARSNKCDCSADHCRCTASPTAACKTPGTRAVSLPAAVSTVA